MNNPQFWLQYAIGAMVIEDLERADQYFATAYSLAKRRPSYDTKMIDNHFARFLLSRAITRDDATSCMSDFRKARELINVQIKTERLHYPFRVARSYADFYEKFASRLEVAALAELGRAAAFVAERVRQLPLERQRDRYVVDCANAMDYIREQVATLD